MKRFLLLGLLLGLASFARPALADETSREIQAQIASGHGQEALSELHNVIAAHPNSGTAWYLTAEAQDSLGNAAAARDALAKAQQFSPGLPFANPTDVAALQAHIATVPSAGFSLPPVLPILGGLVLAFVLFRVFFGRRRPMAVYPQGYGDRMPAQAPYGGMPYPQNQGGGLGSSLLGGLAAGAGFAAGEQIIDRMIGGGGGERPVDDQNIPPPRDDGLQGDPGWSDNSGGSNDDNSW